MCAWAQFGGGHGDASPHFFLFRFCIWSGFKSKSDVCHVLCEELFILDGRPHITKLMLKQSLVWYHPFCQFTYFTFDKIIFSIFQVSRDRERCLTASERHFTLCGILIERLFSCKSESITAAHVRDHSRTMICSVQKCNWLVYMMLENYIFRQISTKLLPKTKSSTIVETVLGWGIQQKIVFNQW